MPILTMASRNHMLPDDFKVKRSCHKCAVNVSSIITYSIPSLYSHHILTLFR